MPTGPIPLEFHVQVSGQEHIPAAKGLADTLVYPTGLPIYHDRVKIVYEWRPEDGKEKRLNPRTQKPYGPIWRASLAEQMEPENLVRHLNTMEAWLNTYVPRSFAGVVCLDVESFPLKSDDFHLGKALKTDLDRRAPGRTQSELMAEFIKVTQDRARQLRPGVKAWGWWGMGSMHPAWPFWNPEQYNAWKRDDAAGDARALQSIEAPMPTLYFPTSFKSEAERAASWTKARENWLAMYGQERLSRDGYVYLNGTIETGPSTWRALTRAEFHECLEQARAMGMRRFVVWDVVDGPQRRDSIQRFLDEVLKPEVAAVVAAEEAATRRGPDRPVPTAPAGRD
jgi:hypothetical protein